MLFSLALSLVTPILLQLVSQTLAIPAVPLSGNPGQTISLPDASETNLTLPLNNRPGNNHLWPESSSGRYYVKFNHYKKQIDSNVGSQLLYVLLPCSCLSLPPSSPLPAPPCFWKTLMQK